LWSDFDASTFAEIVLTIRLSMRLLFSASDNTAIWRAIDGSSAVQTVGLGLSA